MSRDPERECQVAKAYQAQFADPITVEVGEAFAVSERSGGWETNPVWVCCTDQRGKSGWVPKTLIQVDAEGQTGTTHAASNAIDSTGEIGRHVAQRLLKGDRCRRSKGNHGA